MDSEDIFVRSSELKPYLSLDINIHKYLKDKKLS